MLMYCLSGKSRAEIVSRSLVTILSLLITYNVAWAEDAKTPDQVLLISVVKNGHFEEVKRLVESGVTPDLVDEKGVHLAVHAVQSNYPALVDYLATNGMDLNQYGNVAYTPIMLAMRKSESMLDVFIKHSADLNLVSKYASNYSPPITWGIIKRSSDNVVKVIKAGADVNALDSYGLPPVLYAFNQRDITVLEQIFLHGGNPDFVDDNGNTLVAAAIKMGDLNLLKVLGNAGADFEKRDGNGKSPYELAITGSNSQIVQYVKKQLGIT